MKSFKVSTSLSGVTCDAGVMLVVTIGVDLSISSEWDSASGPAQGSFGRLSPTKITAVISGLLSKDPSARRLDQR